MTEKTVLILYGTRYGTTVEIVNKMVEYLKNVNISSEFIDLKEVKSNNISNISEFDSLIIGTGMKINI